MVKVQQIVDSSFTILAILFIIIDWTSEIKIEAQYIPTILNGITSSVALIVGFTVSSITLTITRKLPRPIGATRLGITIFILLFSVLTVFIAYSRVFLSDFHYALKHAMMGLDISVIMLFDFIIFLTMPLFENSRQFKEYEDSE